MVMRSRVPYAVGVVLNGRQFVISVGSCLEEVHVAVAVQVPGAPGVLQTLRSLSEIPPD